MYKKRKIVSVFQPHRYSRVRFLKNEFASSFKLSDLVVLCPVYAAGEKIDGSFSQNLFSKLITKQSDTQVVNVKTKDELKFFLKKNLYQNEVVICMGAGSISAWIRDIVKDLK